VPQIRLKADDLTYIEIVLTSQWADLSEITIIAIMYSNAANRCSKFLTPKLLNVTWKLFFCFAKLFNFDFQFYSVRCFSNLLTFSFLYTTGHTVCKLVFYDWFYEWLNLTKTVLLRTVSKLNPTMYQVWECCVEKYTGKLSNSHVFMNRRNTPFCSKYNRLSFVLFFITIVIVVIISLLVQRRETNTYIHTYIHFPT